MRNCANSQLSHLGRTHFISHHVPMGHGIDSPYLPQARFKLLDDLAKLFCRPKFPEATFVVQSLDVFEALCDGFSQCVETNSRVDASQLLRLCVIARNKRET